MFDTLKAPIVDMGEDVETWPADQTAVSPQNPVQWLPRWNESEE